MEILRTAGPIHQHAEKLKAGGTFLDGDTELVDRISTRPAPTPPCSTAVCGSPVRSEPGTAGVPWDQVLPGPIANTVLKKGKPYRGEVEFQGQPYLVAYDPILGADGQAIGALYVGAPKAGFVSMLDVLVQGGLALGGLAALIVAASSFFAMRLLLAPLTRLSAVMARFAADRLEEEVPGLRRGDEVGAMAASVRVFRDHALKVRAMRAEEERLEDVHREEVVLRSAAWRTRSMARHAGRSKP